MRSLLAGVTPLAVAALVECLEGGALAASAAYLGVETVVGDPSDRSSAVALTVITALLGIGVLLVGLALFRVRRWSRSPAVVTQIFALIVAVSLLRGGWFASGAVLALAGTGAVALLFHPATTKLLARTGGAREGTGQSPTARR